MITLTRAAMTGIEQNQSVGSALIVRVIVSLVALGASSVSAQEPAELDENGVPYGWMIIEGDILVPEDFYGNIAAAYTTILWGDGIVPYEFDSDGEDSVNTTQRQVMLDAMARWENAANLRFRLHETFDTGWLRIRDSSNDDDPSNSSPVGAGLGERTVNITDWDVWTCVHELGHSLGFWHEQSRPNRDDFVQINWDRIPTNKAHNFLLHPAADAYPPGGYDFDSVMHYQQCEFSCCDEDTDPCCTEPCSCRGDLDACRTITVLPPYYTQWQGRIGQRTHLSDFDAMTISFMYPEDDWRFVDAAYGGLFENGTLWEPYKTFSKGVDEVPNEGTLWIQPGFYSAGGTWSKPMTLQAPLGNVTLGN